MFMLDAFDDDRGYALLGSILIHEVPCPQRRSWLGVMTTSSAYLRLLILCFQVKQDKVFLGSDCMTLNLSLLSFNWKQPEGRPLKDCLETTWRPFEVPLMTAWRFKPESWRLSALDKFEPNGRLNKDQHFLTHCRSQKYKKNFINLICGKKFN